jgi:pentatricopeptide repeat protein
LSCVAGESIRSQDLVFGSLPTAIAGGSTIESSCQERFELNHVEKIDLRKGISWADIVARPANPVPSTPTREPNRPPLKRPGAFGLLDTLTKISREPVAADFRLSNTGQGVSQKSLPLNSKIIERFKKRERGVDVAAVRRVTAWGMKTSDLAESKRAVRAMEGAGIDPGPGIYNDLTLACLKAGKVDDALEVFWKVRNAGALHDVSVCNNLIEACSKNGKFKEAFKVVEDMSQAGTTADPLVYDMLKTASDRARVVDKAAELF